MATNDTLNLLHHQQEAVNDERPYCIYWHGLGTGKSYVFLGKLIALGQTAYLVCPKKVFPKWMKELEKIKEIKVMLFTKEQWKKVAPTLPRVDVLMLDEGHHWSNTTSQLFKVTHAWVKKHKPTYLYLATATPYRSGWHNIFAYYTLFGHKPKKYEWRARYDKQVRMGDLTIWKQKTDEQTVNELNQLLEDLCHKASAVTEEETTQYVSVPITLNFPEDYTSLHDIARVENTHPVMLEKLKELVVPGTMVVCFYRTEIELLKELFDAPAVSGQYPYRLEYQDSQKYPVIIAQMDACEGWELPNHGRIVFFSLSYAYSSYVQSKGRIARINNIKKNEYFYLIPKYTDYKGKTVTEQVINNLKQKRSFDPETYENHYITR